MREQAAVEQDSAKLLADIKARIERSQVRAAVAVNRELVLLYWGIGAEISRRQKDEGWGAKVIVEAGLLEQIRRFLLELGVGFAFVGSHIRYTSEPRSIGSTCCSTT